MFLLIHFCEIAKQSIANANDSAKLPTNATFLDILQRTDAQQHSSVLIGKPIDREAVYDFLGALLPIDVKTEYLDEPAY